MKKIFLTLALALGIMASAQVRIGGTGTTVDANAILELQSTTKGLLFPKVALTSTTAFAPLSAHTAGMTVYNTATTGDVTPGMYANSGTAWVKLGGSSSTPAYQDIRGSVTTVTTATYTVLATDNVINTNPASGSVAITFPALTNTAADIGRIVYVFNNNIATGSLTYVGVISGSSVTNQWRGRTFIWTGTQWVNIGI